MIRFFLIDLSSYRTEVVCIRIRQNTNLLQSDYFFPYRRAFYEIKSFPIILIYNLRNKRVNFLEIIYSSISFNKVYIMTSTSMTDG